MRRLFFFGIIISFMIQVKAQIPISFTSEFIDFKIDSNYFSVNGIYAFRNMTGELTNSKISFPFAVNASFIDSIRVLNIKNFLSINYKIIEKGISFNLNMLPYDTLELNINYRQKLARENIYILTTTKTWGVPLEKAVYSLTTSKCFEILSFSIEPDSLKFDLYNKTYYWTKHNFMPQTDFVIYINK